MTLGTNRLVRRFRLRGANGLLAMDATPDVRPAPDHDAEARDLAEGIDRCLRGGFVDGACDIAAIVPDSMAMHVCIRLSLARLHLALYETGPATAMADSADSAGDPVALRLLRITCRLAAGEDGNARRALAAWIATGTAPLRAFLLASWMVIASRVDQQTRRELVSILPAASIQPRDAVLNRAIAAKLTAVGVNPSPTLRVSTSTAVEPRLGDDAVLTLAAELIAAEPGLGLLAATISANAIPNGAAVLAQAIRSGLASFAHPRDAVIAMIRLDLARGQFDEARQWHAYAMRRFGADQTLDALNRALERGPMVSRAA